ncbi:MAG: glycerate kinase [Pseudolysinimonas sp.]
MIAPDSFKGSIGAAAAASAIAEGWRSVRHDDEIRMLPQADGGEGTLAAIASAVAGSEFHAAGDVTGPDGRPVPGRWLQLPDGTAVVELAQSSGLPLMAAPDPLGATTRGLGEVIRAALDDGASALVIGLGGSASTDGGAGALAALGLGLFDTAGLPIGDGGGELARLASIDSSALRAVPTRLLSDVTAPLLGPTGAAAVFGPQKGASPDDVHALDAALAQFAALLGGDPSTPGAGAAGGAGYGFHVAWGARIESGAGAIATLTGLVAEAASADLLITGEGAFDATSLTGKVVGHALGRASRTAVIAGALATAPPDLGWSLTELAGSAEAALADPARWLREAGALAARVRL